MTDDELKLNRRRFLRHSAVAAAATGTLSGIVLRTDVQADDIPLQALDQIRSNGSGTDHPYHYTDPAP